MQELERLALRYGAVAFQQSEAYDQNPNAPAEAGAFTGCAEKRLPLNEEYEAVKGEVLNQIRLYDTYCMQHKQEFSDSWEALLQELPAYLDTANTLSNVLAVRKAAAQIQLAEPQ